MDSLKTKKNFPHFRHKEETVVRYQKFYFLHEKSINELLLFQVKSSDLLVFISRVSANQNSRYRRGKPSESVKLFIVKSFYTKISLRGKSLGQM